MADIKYKKGDADKRPWGAWEVVDVGARHIVKKITVNPHEILSLQKHEHRAEHWVIAEGKAEVTLGETIHQGLPNQSFYIPQRTWHRIANTGDAPLVLIEVETGDVLDENDITRKADKYGR